MIVLRKIDHHVCVLIAYTKSSVFRNFLQIDQPLKEEVMSLTSSECSIATHLFSQTVTNLKYIGNAIDEL